MFPRFIFPQNVMSPVSLLRILYIDSGWILVDSVDSKQQIFIKKVGSSNIHAIMVKRISYVSSASLISAIEDVGNYCSFLPDVYLERADLLGQTSFFIDGYQLLNPPFIANRHYVFRLMRSVDSSVGVIHLNWIPLPRNSKYSAFLDSMDLQYGHPVYLDMNVGGWEIKSLPQGGVELSYRILTDPAGLVPDFLISKANRITAPKIVEQMISEAIRRDRK